MTSKSLFKRMTIAATTSWLVLFAGVPFCLIALTSILTRDPTRFVAFTPSLDAYREILSPGFLQMLLRSVQLAGLTSAVCLVTGYPFAYGMARAHRRFKPLLLLLAIIPFWTNSLIRTYALIFLLKTNGLLNAVLLGLGMIREPLMLLYTDVAVLVGLVYTLLPFMILPLYASIEKLDTRLIEAAQDLGAGRVRTFAYVSLPLTLPGIIAGTMMVFLPALGMFYIPDILGGSKSMLVGNFIKNQFLVAHNWPAGATASVLLTAMMVLMLLVFHWSSADPKRKGLAP
jgi:spermidine/putrescine transport system permease protein